MAPGNCWAHHTNCAARPKGEPRNIYSIYSIYSIYPLYPRRDGTTQPRVTTTATSEPSG